MFKWNNKDFSISINVYGLVISVRFNLAQSVEIENIKSYFTKSSLKYIRRYYDLFIDLLLTYTYTYI